MHSRIVENPRLLTPLAGGDAATRSGGRAGRTRFLRTDLLKRCGAAVAACSTGHGA